MQNKCNQHIILKNLIQLDYLHEAKYRWIQIMSQI